MSPEFCTLIIGSILEQCRRAAVDVVLVGVCHFVKYVIKKCD